MGLPLRVSGLRIEGEARRVIVAVDDLAVAPGTALAIRGPSGAGKSTLLFALAGLLPVASGSILWGETDIARLSEDRRAAFRRDNLGLVFQDYLLFEELGPLANAGVAALYSRSRARRIREAAGATLERLRVPQEGSRTIATFSGGERQRVSVARALAAEPPILLADEPTASLDRASADSLIADLVRIAREGGRTLIAVSHDSSFHAAADKVVDVVDGRLHSDA